MIRIQIIGSGFVVMKFYVRTRCWLNLLGLFLYSNKTWSNVLLFAIFSANNFAMQHKRKTISGLDVLEAMKEMDFERFMEPLSKSLEC